MSSLAPVRPAPPPVNSTVGQYKRVLSEGRAALRADYLPDPAPGRLVKHHAELVDRVLKAVWSDSAMPPQLSLLAVGGYGRSQLFPYSDVDVLFLLPEQLDDDAREKVSELVGTLWDIGLEIGHSARSIDQCVAEAEQDVTVQTNLLEARFLAGDRPLARQFSAAVRLALDPEAFFEAKLLEQRQRHGRFNDTAYNLEPNVKESPGGLRDLTNILWVSTPTPWTQLSSWLSTKSSPRKKRAISHAISVPSRTCAFACTTRSTDARIGSCSICRHRSRINWRCTTRRRSGRASSSCRSTTVQHGR
jgi:[protein-PII] uridylyltransferase